VSEATSDAGVALLSLRAAPTELARERFEAALAAASRAGDDACRLLLIDDAARLGEHHDLFETILASRRVDSMICLAIGPPVDRPQGQALRATPVLTVESVALLWVGDESGVAWRMDTRGAVRPPEAVQTDGSQPLSRLVAALLTAEVFDHVVAAVAQLPNRAANPGLRTAAGQLDLATLLAGHAQAIAMVTGRDADEPTIERGGPSLENCELLVGGDTVLPGYAGPLRPDSPLVRLRAESERSCREADRLVRQMAGLSGLVRPARSGPGVLAAVSTAGRRLGEYHDALTDVLELGDSAGTVDSSRRIELERQGVCWDPVPGLNRLTIVARLQSAVDGAIGRYPLRTLASWLLLVSDRAMPQGSAAHLDRLDRLNPMATAPRLSSPPPLPLAAVPAPALAAVATGCLLAGVVPGWWGAVAGGVFAVLWLVMVTVAYRREAAQRGERSARAVLRSGLLAHAGAALAGLAAGRAVAVALAPTPLLSTVPVRVATAAAAAALLGFALSRWWSAAVHQWRTQLRLDRAVRVIAAQDAILREAALREWVLAGQRSFLSDAARAMAGAVREVAESLDGWRERHASDADAAAAPVATLDRDAVGDLQSLLAEDVADAARATLAPCWEVLRSGALDRVRLGVAEDAEALMDQHRQHLARQNIDQRPPFARRGDDARSPRLAQAWGPPGHLAEVVGAASDGLLVQLCAAEDLQLLEPGRWGTQAVRFAPRSTQDLVLDHGPRDARLDDVVWTGSGHLAGVIRLVALRAGAVELIWPEEAPDAHRL